MFERGMERVSEGGWGGKGGTTTALEPPLETVLEQLHRFSRVGKCQD